MKKIKKLLALFLAFVLFLLIATQSKAALAQGHAKDQFLKNSYGYGTRIGDRTTSVYAHWNGADKVLSFYEADEPEDGSDVVADSLKVIVASHADDVKKIDFSRLNNEIVLRDNDAELLFSSCSDLESIKNLDKLNTANIRSMAGMFYGCSKIKSIDLSGLETDNLTHMATAVLGNSGVITGMFTDCKNLENINFNNFDTSKVVNMTGLFSGCSSLRHLAFDMIETGNVEEMFGIFRNTAFKVIDISTWDLSKLKTATSMFVKCASLKTVKFKSGGNFKIQRFGRAFWFCDDLENIDISAFDLRDSTSTSWAYLQEIFYQDFNLKRVAVGEGWLQKPSSKTNFTVNMYRIDDQSFTPHLKDTLIPNGKGEYVVRKMIKFDGNDADSGAMNDEHIYYSLSKKLPKNTFKRDGFIFAGWGLKQNDDIVDFTDRQSINFSDLGNSMNDVVLYAKWLPTVNIEVKKIWKYVNGNLINPPYQKTEIELHKDGKPTGNKLELNAANHWSGEFKQLPVAESPGSHNHKYTVKEFGEENNSIKLGKMRFKVIYEGNMKNGYTVINEAVPLTLQKTPKQKPVTGVSADIKQLPKTGYRENLALYGLLLAISGGMLLIGLRRRRGNSKNNNTDISS